MSANLSVTASPLDGLPNVTQLTDLFGQLRTRMGDVNVPGLPVAAVGNLAAGFNLSLPDTSSWSSIVPPDASQLLRNFPDPAALAAPLGAPLGQIRELFSLNFRGEITRVEQAFGSFGPPSTEDPAALLNDIFSRFSSISALVTDSELTKLVSAIGALVGADAMRDLPTDAAAFVARVQSIVEEKIKNTILAVVAVSSAATITERTERVARAAAGWFSLETTNARFAALLDAYGADANSLAAQIRALDFANAAAVEAARVRLGATVAAFDAYHTGLTRDLAFGEASLALLDLGNVEAGFRKVGETVARVDAAQLANLADSLRALLARAQSAIRIDGSLDIEQYKTHVRDGLRLVRTELDKLDPAGLQRAFQNFFDQVTGPLRSFESFKVEIEAAVRDAFQVVRDAVSAIDITPIRERFNDAMGQLDARIVELNELFADVRQTVRDALREVETALEAARAFVLDPQNGLKKQIEDLFNMVFSLFDQLDIQGAVEEVRRAVEPISQNLTRIEFAPTINATVDAVETVSDVLRTAAPLLVTDDLKQKLAEATEFLRQIDFDEITGTLIGGFDEILAAIDEEALGRFEQEYDRIVEAVGGFDPAPMLRELQSEVFNPLIAELERVHPAELLRPLQEGYEAAGAALNGFDPTASFAFITDFFDELQRKLDEISPVRLLEPVESALAEVRTTVNTFLRLDELLTALDSVSAPVMQFIDSVNVEQLFERLEPGFAGMRAAIEGFDLAQFAAPLAAVLRDAFASSGMKLDDAGMVGLFHAVRARSAGLQARFTGMQQLLAQGQTQIGQLDVRAALMTLRAKHDELRAALDAKDHAAPAYTEFEARVAALDPMPTISPLGSKVGRVQASFTVKAEGLGQLTQSLAATFQGVDALLAAMGSLLSPFELLEEMIAGVVGRMFPGGPAMSIKELLLRFMDEINPQQWRAELEPLLVSIQTKLRVLFGDAVLGPLKETLRSIKSAIDALNITALTEAVEGAFSDVEAAVQQFNPAPVIEAMGETYRRILGLLEQLNPAEFIAEIDRIYTEDVIGVVRAISPEELLLPSLQELFERITGLLAAFDVRVIFDPVLAHLRLLRDQLAEGLERAGTAFNQMLDTLDSAAGAGGSVSVSASIG